MPSLEWAGGNGWRVANGLVAELQENPNAV
jgi:hypothetical protein